MKQQNEPDVAKPVEPFERAPWEAPELVKVDVSRGTLNANNIFGGDSTLTS